MQAVKTPTNFERDYRAGFDWLTEALKGCGVLKDYTFTEMTMPDGEIQRWWTGNDESVILRYKRYKKMDLFSA